MTPLKDWKTTSAGIALIIVALAMCFRVVTFNEFLTATAFLLGGGGLVAAKDSGREEAPPQT